MTTTVDHARDSSAQENSMTKSKSKATKVAVRKGATLTKSRKAKAAPAKQSKAQAAPLPAGRPTATLPKGEHVKLVATCQKGEEWITGKRWVCGIEGTSPKRTGIVFWKYRNRTAQEIVGHPSGYTWRLDAPDVESPAHKRATDRAARAFVAGRKERASAGGAGGEPAPRKPRQAKMTKSRPAPKSSRRSQQESLSPEELTELTEALPPMPEPAGAKPPTDPSALSPGDRVRVPERFLNGVKLAPYSGEVVTVTSDEHGPVIHVRNRSGQVRLARTVTRTRKAKATAAAA
jgi:hypothetical protein